MGVWEKYIDIYAVPPLFMIAIQSTISVIYLPGSAGVITAQVKIFLTARCQLEQRVFLSDDESSITII